LASILVLIAIISVLVLLVIAVIIVLCRLYLWNIIFKKKHHYKKLSTSKSDKNPKDIHSENQLLVNDSLFPFESSNSKMNRYWRHSSSQFDFSSQELSQSQQFDSQSDYSSSDVFHFDDSFSAKSSGSEFDRRDWGRPYSGIPPSRKLTKSSRMRFRSEPILNKNLDKVNGSNLRPQRRFIKKRIKSSKVLSVLTPAAGQIEFSLFYDPDERSLVINIIQLTNIVLTAECFADVLEVVDHHNSERNKANSVHLIRNSDGKLELSEYIETGFSICISLLNKKKYLDQPTSTVFGEQNALFNEKFTISGQSLEQLASSCLYMHALCMFGRNSEPIVIGEVKVPLKRLQTSQLLPFLATLAQPEIEVVLEVS